MKCSCSINAGISEYAKLFSSGWVKSRSVHKCTECGKKMLPGEGYYRERVKFDGRFSAHKTCNDCISIRSNLCGDWTYGQVLETVSDAIEAGHDIPERCLSKLTPAARAWVCDLIEKLWENEKK